MDNSSLDKGISDFYLLVSSEESHLLERKWLVREIISYLGIYIIGRITQVSKTFRDVAYLPCYLGRHAHRAPPKGCRWNEWKRDCANLEREVEHILDLGKFDRGKGLIWGFAQGVRKLATGAGMLAGAYLFVKVPTFGSYSTREIDPLALPPNPIPSVQAAQGARFLGNAMWYLKVYSFLAGAGFGRVAGIAFGEISGTIGELGVFGVGAIFHHRSIVKWRHALEATLESRMERDSQSQPYRCAFTACLLRDPVEVDGVFYERMELERRNISTTDKVSDYRIKAAILGRKNFLLASLRDLWRAEWNNIGGIWDLMPDTLPSMSDQLAVSSLALQFNLRARLNEARRQALEFIEVCVWNNAARKPELIKELEDAISGEVVVPFTQR